MKTRGDFALQILEQLAGGEKIRGLVSLDGVEIPLVRCHKCSALLDVAPAAGPHIYDCHGCGEVVAVAGA